MKKLAITPSTVSEETTVLALAGDVDLSSIDQLEDAVARCLASAELRGIVLDLSETSFVDSVAIALVLDLDEQLIARGGRLALARPSAAVARVLDLLKLDQLVVVDDLDAAVSRAAAALP